MFKRGPTQISEICSNASKLENIGVELCRMHISRLTITKVDCISKTLKDSSVRESVYNLAEGIKSLGC